MSSLLGAAAAGVAGWSWALQWLMCAAAAAACYSHCCRRAAAKKGAMRPPAAAALLLTAPRPSTTPGAAAAKLCGGLARNSQPCAAVPPAHYARHARYSASAARFPRRSTTAQRAGEQPHPQPQPQPHDGDAAGLPGSRAFCRATPTRRAVLGALLPGASALAVGAGLPIAGPAGADEGAAADEPMTVYFGCGCFWHVQHEFVQLEKKVLGRNEAKTITTRTGYAGGTGMPKGAKVLDKVCYHNGRRLNDYGSLGYAEVVALTVPRISYDAFAQLYFDLFVPFANTGYLDRNDPGDMGGEYRSLVGLPGGVRSPLFASLKKYADLIGFQLVEGKGNEPDTFLKKRVYVHDSNAFPFYQAEVYHQFHNDFQGPAYGRPYNDLREQAEDAGTLQPTGCPEGFFA